jgi:hypothetical protein
MYRSQAVTICATPVNVAKKQPNILSEIWCGCVFDILGSDFGQVFVLEVSIRSGQKEEPVE